MIYKRLMQASANYYVPIQNIFSHFSWRFQQLPPVGDAAIYYGECLIFQSIGNVVVLKESHWQAGESQEASVQLLSHFQQVKLDESYWNLLKGRFCQIATDAKHAKWDNAPHLFNDNKYSFEYNIQNLIGLDSPIFKLTATNNNGYAAKCDSTEANG